MRVLFVSSPAIGHAFPMVPLAWALRTAGHDVLVATAGRAMAVQQAGLAVVDVAPDYAHPRPDAHTLQRLQALAPRTVEDLRHRSIPVEMLTRISVPLVDRAVDLAGAWRPDLVVSSQVDGAGMVVAGALRIPLVIHRWGFVRTDGLPRLYRRLLAEQFDRHGVTEVPQPAATVDVAPPSMLDEPSRDWPMRYISYNGSGQLPPWLTVERQARSRVAVTLGTVAPTMTGIDPVRRVIDAAAGLDLELVLALGDDVDPTPLGPLPEQVRVSGWVPLNVLLSTCVAVIHHGGAGSTMAALDAGIPQLILPSGADRYLNAQAVSRRGAGLQADEAGIDTAVLHRLLHDHHLREAANEVRSEIHAMPLPSSLIAPLTELAHTRLVPLNRR